MMPHSVHLLLTVYSLQAKYSILPEQSEIERLEAQAFLQVRAGSSGEHCTQL